MLLIGFLTALILLAISGLHLYWAVGGRWGSDVAIPTRAGSSSALFRPTALMTLFARYDTVYFTPLCLGLTLMIGLVAYRI